MAMLTSRGENWGHKCCKLRTECYRFRWFHSKGAVLVVFWLFLIITTQSALLNSQMYGETPAIISTGVCILILIAAPFFGWLADAKLGNYRIVSIGFILSFLASLINCVYYLLYYNIPLASADSLRIPVLIVVAVLYWSSTNICIVNGIQLALEQLPDGSAENIASLISWFFLASFAGVWIGEVLVDLNFACASSNHTMYQILMLVPILFSSIALGSYYILSPKWLIIEPNTPQSLKNIFRVLKFAAKHKAPLNRSALTYWEEDIPSRLDLGKSRFGGPFTTEQVEDVKTFFRLLAVGVSLFTVMFALKLHNNVIFESQLPGLSICGSHAVFQASFAPWWCALLTTAIYEFVIYPCFNFRLPSLMKRIGFVATVLLFHNIVHLVLTVLEYFSYTEHMLWQSIVNFVVFGLLAAVLFLSSLEFVCAQSPYNIRGLMTGYFSLVVWVAYGSAYIVGYACRKHCHSPYCSLMFASIAAAVSLFAFVLYLIIARWYKMRVRDNEYPQQAVVEEVYDRYLSAQTAHS